MRKSTETLASPDESEREGGLSPPPNKRPRLLTGASEDQGGPSSSSLPLPVISEGRSCLSDLPLSTEQSSGAPGISTVDTSAVAMQSNGVIENGTVDEIAVNGLGSGVPGKGHKNGVCEEGEGVEVGGVNQRLAGEVRLRKKRPKQLSGKDVDIIRLIGQHLREMGFG